MKTRNQIIQPVVVEAVESRIFMSAVEPPIVGPQPTLENTLVILQQPKTGNDGKTLGQITVDVFDSSTGQLATNDDSQITMSGDSLSGTTIVTAQNGVAVFSDLTINTTGSEVLTASGDNLTSTQTQPIVVTNTVTAGQRIAPIIVNPSNLFSTSANSKWLKVKLVDTLNGKVSLTKTYYPKRGSSVMINSLSSLIAGNFDVVASDSLGHTATLEQVTVAPAAPHELWFSTQPRVLDSDAIVTVTVLDQYGNVTTAEDGSEVDLYSWLPKGSTGDAPVLTGNTSAVVVDGVATFSGLGMNQTGKAHLIAHLGSLKPTVSHVFQPGATLNVDPGNDGPTV